MANFIDVAEFGGHWCRRCQRYVAVAESDQGRPRSCERCGSHSLRFDPPVEGFHRDSKPNELAKLLQ